ncbi:GNAT family N-acetyltransferase [Virgibacillus sp. JSM 102003]|uniref:GNAT family N-acetyltransferase n=1 Tax=Virgibacillus sp. JSM 102003 TaxID=1562108 RepID=UPI0035BF0E63
MQKTIRTINDDDFQHVEAMDTGIEDDYIKRVFNRLITGSNRLYGLFLGDQMVSLGGSSIYASRYVMLGRLRTDRRYIGNGFSTELMTHMMNKAFQINGIKWVGANTQEFNKPARRVMERIGLTPFIPQHAAQTKDTLVLETGSELWTQVTDVQQKREWLNKMYSNSTSIFPYECYYSFPVSKDLFQERDLRKWSFYENNLKTRALITKTDQKKHHYLHAIYPWNDITSQEGLWETISNDYKQLRNQTGEETFIWMDLTKEQVNNLPKNHQFTLPSPWILHGIDKSDWERVQALD